MKANELRKGNLIYGKISEDEDGNDINELILCEFLGYDPFEGNFWVDAVEEKKAREYYDSFEPIPLTEEWLLKLGFYEVEETEVFDKEIGGERYISINIKSKKCFVGASVNWTFIKFPEHVHQLQNLYHALTGSELPTDHCKLTTE